MSLKPRDTAQRKRLRARIRATKANCHICGQPIDYNLPHTDPMSFVVDHVIPLSKGGADTIENSRASHARCNAKKSARLIAPIVRRSRSLE